jgi:hypothetical protein
MSERAFFQVLHFNRNDGYSGAEHRAGNDGGYPRDRWSHTFHRQVLRKFDTGRASQNINAVSICGTFCLN